MSLLLFLVDAFTDTAFSGNPAAICILPEPCSDHWMQQVAREMNLSETAFLFREANGFHLRWFTPIVEVDLCGHATLASAHVLWEAGYLNLDEEARFQTRSGLLTARHTGAQKEQIELDFPSEVVSDIDTPPDLATTLGIPLCYVGRTSRRTYLVQTDSEETVRRVQPNFTTLAQMPLRSVIVTSHSASPTYDFVSRYFAPRLGVNEDPVTGSAHCCLGPFWSERLGKTELVAYQASPRGGKLDIRVCGERIFLSGRAVTVLRGMLLV